MYTRLLSVFFIVAAVILGYFELSVVDKYGITLAVLLIIVTGLWWVTERHTRAQAKLIDLLEKKANSDRASIEQFSRQVRRLEGDVSQAGRTVTTQAGQIVTLERRLREATSIPNNPGHVSTRQAILEPTPPARMASLPGFDQNRVPREERRMGDHYRETIRDDGDNGLGSFALGALVGSALSGDTDPTGKTTDDRTYGAIEPGGGSFGGGGATASWSEPSRSSPVESSSRDDNSYTPSSDSDSGSPSGGD